MCRNGQQPRSHGQLRGFLQNLYRSTTPGATTMRRREHAFNHVFIQRGHLRKCVGGLVGPAEVPPVKLPKGLRLGAGDMVPLKPKEYFRHFPHL